MQYWLYNIAMRIEVTKFFLKILAERLAKKCCVVVGMVIKGYNESLRE
jgi:hypothetical protein